MGRIIAIVGGFVAVIWLWSLCFSATPRSNAVPMSNTEIQNDTGSSFMNTDALARFLRIIVLRSTIANCGAHSVKILKKDTVSSSIASNDEVIAPPQEATRRSAENCCRTSTEDRKCGVWVTPQHVSPTIVSGIVSVVPAVVGMFLRV